ncbi:MAG: TIR domain-containing protein [Planctomycetes bacterium]|nr:TIR domain-containing protein [Planctomycetota bacterium]
MSGDKKEKNPVVFISYSQDSSEHKDKVLAFANKLREDGIDAILDQFEEAPVEGWPKWMDRQIETCDFTILICTETYNRRVMGKEEKDKGHGVQWESTIIYQYLYDTGSKIVRFIPVLFKNGKKKNIPKPLGGQTYYCVEEKGGYESLYRRFTGQPWTRKRKLGKIMPLSVRTPKTDFFGNTDLNTGGSTSEEKEELAVQLEASLHKKPQLGDKPLFDQPLSSDNLTQTTKKSTSKIASFKDVYKFALSGQGMSMGYKEAEVFATKWISQYADKDFSSFKEAYEFALSGQGMCMGYKEAEVFALKQL